MHQLLVEQLAQPGELVGVAEIGRLDHLVELLGEGAIAGLVLAALARIGFRRPAGRLGLSSPPSPFISISVSAESVSPDSSWPLSPSLPSISALSAESFSPPSPLASLGSSCLIVVVLVLAVVGLQILRARIEVEIADQPAHRLGIGALVVHHLGEPGEIGPGGSPISGRQSSTRRLALAGGG